jgi:hypothetical protein
VSRRSGYNLLTQDNPGLQFPHLGLLGPGLIGLGHGCHALPQRGLLGLGLEEGGRGCVQHLTLEQVLDVVLEEVVLGVEE